MQRSAEEVYLEMIVSLERQMDAVILGLLGARNILAQAHNEGTTQAIDIRPLVPFTTLVEKESDHFMALIKEFLDEHHHEVPAYQASLKVIFTAFVNTAPSNQLVKEMIDRFQ